MVERIVYKWQLLSPKYDAFCNSGRIESSQMFFVLLQNPSDVSNDPFSLSHIKDELDRFLWCLPSWPTMSHI